MNRSMRFGLLALLAAYVVWKGIVPAMTRIDTDFPNYYTGARIVLNGEECSRLYNNAWFNSRAAQFGIDREVSFIPFPPPTVFVMMPLAWLPPLTALQCWTVVNIALLLLSVRFLVNITGRDAVWCALIVLAAGQGLINEFRFGQWYLVMLFALLWLYNSARRNNDMRAGIALGVSASIKYFPLVYVPWLIARRQWRIAGWAVAVVVVLYGAAFVVVGRAACMDFVLRIAGSHAAGDIPGQAHYTAAFASWNSMLRRVFLDDAAASPAPVIAWPEGLAIVLGGVYLIVAVTTAFAWRWAAHAADAAALRFALLTCAAFVVLPATASYHMLLFVPAVALLLAPRHRWNMAQWMVLGGYIAIAFAPMGFFLSFDGKGLLTLLAYPRVWILSAVYGATVWLCGNASRTQRT